MLQARPYHAIAIPVEAELRLVRSRKVFRGGRRPRHTGTDRSGALDAAEYRRAISGKIAPQDAKNKSEAGILRQRFQCHQRVLGSIVCCGRTQLRSARGAY